MVGGEEDTFGQGGEEGRTNFKDENFPNPKRIRNKTAKQSTNNLYPISRDQF